MRKGGSLECKYRPNAAYAYQREKKKKKKKTEMGVQGISFSRTMIGNLPE